MFFLLSCQYKKTAKILGDVKSGSFNRNVKIQNKNKNKKKQSNLRNIYIIYLREISFVCLFIPLYPSDLYFIKTSSTVWPPHPVKRAEGKMDKGIGAGGKLRKEKESGEKGKRKKRNGHRKKKNRELLGSLPSESWRCYCPCYKIYTSKIFEFGEGSWG